MNKLTCGCAALICMVSGSVLASPQVQLSFTAEAVQPPCHIQQAPATLDFGNIHRDQLATKTSTQLPVKAFPGGITIQCEAPTSIGLSAVDNSGGSATPTGNLTWNSPAVNITPAQTDQRFGLGMTDSGKAIGMWNVAFHSAQVDGSVAQMGIVNNGVLDLNDTTLTMRKNSSVIAWTKDNAIAEGSLFTVQIDAAVAIAPLEDLPSGSEIDFAGSATLEITYL